MHCGGEQVVVTALGGLGEVLVDDRLNETGLAHHPLDAAQDRERVAVLVGDLDGDAGVAHEVLLSRPDLMPWRLPAKIERELARNLVPQEKSMLVFKSMRVCCL